MPYESLSPEQKARADALQVASSCFGSPKEPLDADLVCAAQWILTGEHPSLPQDVSPPPAGTQQLDGGGPGTYAYGAAAHQAESGLVPDTTPHTYAPTQG